MTQRARLLINDTTQRRDGSVENSTISVQTVVPAGDDLSTTRPLHNTFVVTTMAICLGVLVQDEFGGFTTYTAPGLVPAPDPNAQRERKWKVVGYVNSGARGYPRYSRTIAAADLAGKLPNEERLDPTNALYLNLKAAWEAYVLDDGDPIIVDRVILVGRNT